MKYANEIGRMQEILEKGNQFFDRMNLHPPAGETNWTARRMQVECLMKSVAWSNATICVPEALFQAVNPRLDGVFIGSVQQFPVLPVQVGVSLF